MWDEVVETICTQVNIYQKTTNIRQNQQQQINYFFCIKRTIKQKQQWHRHMDNTCYTHIYNRNVAINDNYVL